MSEDSKERVYTPDEIETRAWLGDDNFRLPDLRRSQPFVAQPRLGDGAPDLLRRVFQIALEGEISLAH